MKTIKKTAEYTILKRTDGRYAVQGNNKKFINGEDKVKILTEEGLLTVPAPKPAEPDAAAASATEEAAE